jgi:phage protein D
MGLVPTFKVKVNGESIATSGDGFPLEVSVVDEEGLLCDFVTVTFGDPMGLLAVPKLGAKLTVDLGYEGDLGNFGEYFIDECEISSSGRMSIRCKSIDYRSALRNLNTRSFPKGIGEGISIEKIAQEVAKPYSMKVSCDEYTKSISFRKIHQRNETDLHFLTRLSQSRGCTLKIKENVICILAKGTGQTATGLVLPVVDIVRTQNVISWRYSRRQSEEYKSVSAFWRAWDTSEDKTVRVGSGEPVYGIPYRFPTEKEAKDAAKSKLESLRYGVESLECEIHGDIQIRAERLANVKDLRNSIDGKWVIKRAEHRINHSGYVVSVQCERST